MEDCAGRRDRDAGKRILWIVEASDVRTAVIRDCTDFSIYEMVDEMNEGAR